MSRKFVIMTILITAAILPLTTKAFNENEDLVTLPAYVKNFADEFVESVTVYDIHIGELDETYYADPGEMIQIKLYLDQRYWPQPEKVQLMLFYSWTNEWPPREYKIIHDGPCPHNGFYIHTWNITVPTNPGVYYLWVAMDTASDIDTAIKKFTTPLTTAHAKIIVYGMEPKLNLTLHRITVHKTKIIPTFRLTDEYGTTVSKANLTAYVKLPDRKRHLNTIELGQGQYMVFFDTLGPHTLGHYLGINVFAIKENYSPTYYAWKFSAFMIVLPYLVSAFGSYPGHSRWLSSCDTNYDGVVNIIDIALLAKDF